MILCNFMTEKKINRGKNTINFPVGGTECRREHYLLFFDMCHKMKCNAANLMVLVGFIGQLVHRCEIMYCK